MATLNIDAAPVVEALRNAYQQGRIDSLDALAEGIATLRDLGQPVDIDACIDACRALVEQDGA